MQISNALKSFGDRFRQDIQTIKSYIQNEVRPYLTDKNHRQTVKTAKAARKKAQRFQHRTNIAQQKHFIKSVNRSDKHDFTIRTYGTFKRYRRAHAFYASPVSKMWRALSRQPFYVRIPVIISAFAGAKMLSLAAIPFVFIGMYGLNIGNRLATGSLAKSARDLRKDGLDAPYHFYAQDEKLLHPMARTRGQSVEIKKDITMETPVQNAARPMWLVQGFDFEQNRKDGLKTVHAATYEALMFGKTDQLSLTEDVLADAADSLIKILFPEKTEEQKTDMLKGWNSEQRYVLFSDKTHEFKSMFSRVAEKDQLSKASLRDAIVFAIAPFCKEKANSKTGLSLLTGKITVQDLNALVKLRASGRRISKADAAEITQRLYDRRFEDMSFQNIVKTVVEFDDKEKQLFDMIWKEGQYRRIFNFDQICDIIENYNGWGQTALQIAGNDYARDMTGEIISELIEPANEGWAMDYLDLLTDRPRASQAMQSLLGKGRHTAIRDIVKSQGLASEFALCQMAGTENPARDVAVTSSCPTAKRLAEMRI